MSFTSPRRVMSRAFGLLLLVGVASWALAGAPLAVAKAASEKVQGVFITNTDDAPVPARVTNEVSARVTNEVSARIANDQPIRVAPVSDAAGQHVQVSRTMDLDPTEGAEHRVLLSVPAGKKFVAKQVNGEVRTASRNRCWRRSPCPD